MKKNENYTLDAMFDVWQRHGERIDRIAGEHPVTEARFTPRARRLLPAGLSGAAMWLRVAACLAAMAWLLCTYKTYVVDTLDVIPHLLAGTILVVAVVVNLRHPRGSAMARHTVALALTAIILIACTPAYDGRSMSVSGREARSVALADADWIINNINREVA